DRDPAAEVATAYKRERPRSALVEHTGAGKRAIDVEVIAAIVDQGGVVGDRSTTESANASAVSDLPRAGADDGSAAAADVLVDDQRVGTIEDQRAVVVDIAGAKRTAVPAVADLKRAVAANLCLPAERIVAGQDERS